MAESASDLRSTRLRDLIVLSASSCVDALLAASAKASSNSCAAATVSCTAVRKLYWLDWFRYQQQCLGSPPEERAQLQAGYVASPEER